MSAQIKTRALGQSEAPAIVDDEGEVLQPGTLLLGGQYVIDKYLSSGGFGITYLARDSLKRRVVIKECYPEALCTRRHKTVKVRSTSHSNEFKTLVSMFVREARSIASLDHPNIVGVHQIFEDNETAYMVLDLIEGPDLLALLDSGERMLSPDQVRVLLVKLLKAIGTVHAQDMLHRDISPDNVLLDAEGEPVLIDFGAAREQASKKSRAISALLVVKDGYSPQEFYISGGQQGPFSDLYSLAATFYHLITGTPPPVSQERLAAIAASRPDPYVALAGRVPGFDDRFLATIDKAMSVLPNDRIQTAADWLASLDGHSMPQTSAEHSDIKRIVSRLVVEVGAAIDEDKKTASRIASEAAKPAEPKEPPRKYLTPPDDPAVTTGRPFGWLRIGRILLAGVRSGRVLRICAFIALAITASALVSAMWPDPIADASVNITPGVSPLSPAD